MNALDATIHKRLIQDLEGISSQSRVPVQMIENSSRPHLEKDHLKYLHNFSELRGEGGAHVVLGPSPNASAETTMMAIAAVLIRNFIDARVVTLSELVDGDGETCSVLLCPNFYCQYHGGKPLTSWQVQKIYSLLLSRASSGKVNILFVEDEVKCADHYGDSLKSHLSKYQRL